LRGSDNINLGQVRGGKVFRKRLRTKGAHQEGRKAESDKERKYLRDTPMRAASGKKRPFRGTLGRESKIRDSRSSSGPNTASREESSS